MTTRFQHILKHVNPFIRRWFPVFSPRTSSLRNDFAQNSWLSWIALTPPEFQPGDRMEWTDMGWFWMRSASKRCWILGTLKMTTFWRRKSEVVDSNRMIKVLGDLRNPQNDVKTCQNFFSPSFSRGRLVQSLPSAHCCNALSRAGGAQRCWGAFCLQERIMSNC